MLPSGSIAGVNQVFYLMTRDRYGNPLVTGGLSVTARIEPTNVNNTVAVRDLNSGSYELTAIATKKGTYAMRVLIGATTVGLPSVYSISPGTLIPILDI